MADPRMTEQAAQVFLASPRIGVLSVASDTNRPPLTTPLWYHYQPGGMMTFFTGTGGRTARKTRLIKQAGAVTLCVQQDHMPYKYVIIEGAVVKADQPPTSDAMLAIVRRYLPEEAAQGFVQAELALQSPTLVLFTVRPDRWMSAVFGDES